MKKMKRFLGILLSLVMALGMMPGISMMAYAYTPVPGDGSDAGSGDVYFVGYTTGTQAGDFVAGVDGSNMFDGRDDNKACIGFSNYYSVEFSYASEIVPHSYYFRTGDDTSGYSKRNPSAWKLEGKDSNGNWNLLDNKSGASFTTDDNTAVKFDINNNKAYQTFRLTITAINQNGNDAYPINNLPTFQLSEVYMSGATDVEDDNNDEVDNNDWQEVTTVIERTEGADSVTYTPKAKLAIETPGVNLAEASMIQLMPGPMHVAYGGPEEGELGIYIIVTDPAFHGDVVSGKYSVVYEGKTYEGDFNAVGNDGFYECMIIVPLSGSNSTDSSSSGHSHHVCEDGHKFNFHVLRVPTTETDGVGMWCCDRCGIADWNAHDNADPGERVVLSAYPVFNDTLEKNIKAAESGATVSITTSRWVSVRRGVLEALAEKPGVTLTVNFEYQGMGYVIAIPGGDPALAGILASEDRFFGLMNLGNTYGLTAVEK